MTVRLSSHRARVASIAPVACALLLGGCGGSSTSTSSGTRPSELQAATGGAQAANGGKAGSTHTGSGSIHRGGTATKGSDPIASGGGKPLVRVGRRSVGANGQLVSQESGGSIANPANPCGLVTRAEAGAILGSRIVAETEAPLGPTCIFRAQGQRSLVTVALEQLSVARLVAPKTTGWQRIAVSGHVAFCGTLGRPMLFLSISGGRALNVTAPCATAKELAAKALTRLKA